jgi:chaperonin GroES
MQNMQSMMGDPNQAMEAMQGAAPQPMGGGEAPMDPAMAGAMSPPMDPAMAMGMGEQTQPEEDSTKWIDFALLQSNLAKRLSKTKKGKETLSKIGEEVSRGYEEDENSRAEWMKNNKEWLELSLLVRKNKTFPWPKASNVKFPLVATAAMQFSARAFPSLVPADGQVVKGSINQKHANGQLYDAAKRVGHHMSFQLKHRMPRWEEDMDKLLMTMAVSGICFKKTYYDGCAKENRSYLVYPENLCVNYYAKDLDSAYRKTEILYYTANEVREKVLYDEEFLDVLEDQEAGVIDAELKSPLANKTQQPSADSSTPHVFLQQHTFWDLDEDGYEEPYVITVHKNSRKVVRIVARWDLDGVTRNEEGDIIRIKPVEYYTDFPFVPNPDGSLYALGFGTLLGPLNISVNSLINMLIDSGVINNLQSGFIGKGLRIKMGETTLAPGEWKVVNATGDDLSKSIFPLPSKEPSGVLFNLMNLLIQSGNQLASIAEIMVGKMPGQNTPATTTQETVQQSMAVFTAIYKRVYRSLDSEFKKLYRLNSLNPDTVQEETKLAGIPLQTSDYDFPDWMIVPAADPTGDSATVRAQKMQQVGGLLQFGVVNVQEYAKMMVELLDIPDAERLLQPPPPPQPDPKAQAMQMQAQLDQQKAQMDMQMKQQELQIKQQLAELDMMVKKMDLMFKQQEAQMKLTMKKEEGRMNMVKMVGEQQHAQREMQADSLHADLMREKERVQTDTDHQMNLRHSEESHMQKQQQQAAAKPKEGKPKR